MTDKELKQKRIDLLIEKLPDLKFSYCWMLEDIKTRADELNPGAYSDEMLLALTIGELLGLIE